MKYSINLWRTLTARSANLTMRQTPVGGREEYLQEEMSEADKSEMDSDESLFDVVEIAETENQ